MFGSCRIDERKEAAPRQSPGFDDGELNFDGCSVRLLARCETRCGID